MDGITYNSPEYIEYQKQWAYLLEHVEHMEEEIGAVKGYLSRSFIETEPNWQVKFLMPDETYLEFKCDTLKEFMECMYGDEEVPVL